MTQVTASLHHPTAGTLASGIASLSSRRLAVDGRRGDKIPTTSVEYE
jgi:hypothetical protein